MEEQTLLLPMLDLCMEVEEMPPPQSSLLKRGRDEEDEEDEEDTKGIKKEKPGEVERGRTLL